MACAARGEPGGVYNLASGVETTIRELAELVNEVTGNPTPIALTPARDWDHSGQRFGSTDKARASSASRRTPRCATASRRTSTGRARTSSWIERCIARHADRMPDLPARRSRELEAAARGAASDRAQSPVIEPAQAGASPAGETLVATATSSTSSPSAT